jgi:hypothetical protein
MSNMPVSRTLVEVSERRTYRTLSGHRLVAVAPPHRHTFTVAHSLAGPGVEASNSDKRGSVGAFDIWHRAKIAKSDAQAAVPTAIAATYGNRSCAAHHRPVLAGVKAKPFGWPSASLPPGCAPAQHPS